MVRTYYGCNIYRNETSGYRLRWSAYLKDRFVSADTLSDIKAMIRHELTKDSKKD